MSLTDLPTKQEFIQEMSKVKIYSFSQPDWHFIFNSKTIILFILSFIAFSILLGAFLKREKIMERILKEDTGYQASLVFIVLFIISLMPLSYLTTYQSIANSYQFYQSIPDNGNSKVIHSEISVTNDKDIIHQIDLFKSATLSLAKNELQSGAINSCLKYGKVSNMDNFMNCLERETREDSLALHFYKFFSLLFSLAFFLSIVYIGIFFGDKELFNRIIHFFKKTFKLFNNFRLQWLAKFFSDNHSKKSNNPPPKWLINLFSDELSENFNSEREKLFQLLIVAKKKFAWAFVGLIVFGVLFLFII